MHRFIWDLRYAAPKAIDREYPIAAIYRDTPRAPRGALVLPGQYKLNLVIAGKTYSQPLTLRMDPRIKTPMPGLEEQLALSLRLSDLMEQDYDALLQVRQSNGPVELKNSLEKLNRDLAHVYEVIQGSDNAPTTQAKAAVADLEGQWKQLNPKISVH